MKISNRLLQSRSNPLLAADTEVTFNPPLSLVASVVSEVAL